MSQVLRGPTGAVWSSSSKCQWAAVGNRIYLGEGGSTASRLVPSWGWHRRETKQKMNSHKRNSENNFLLSIGPKTNTETGKFASTGSLGSLSFVVSTLSLTDTAHISQSWWIRIHLVRLKFQFWTKTFQVVTLFAALPSEHEFHNPSAAGAYSKLWRTIRDLAQGLGCKERKKGGGNWLWKAITGAANPALRWEWKGGFLLSLRSPSQACHLLCLP